MRGRGSVVDEGRKSIMGLSRRVSRGGWDVMGFTDFLDANCWHPVRFVFEAFEVEHQSRARKVRNGEDIDGSSDLTLYLTFHVLGDVGTGRRVGMSKKVISVCILQTQMTKGRLSISTDLSCVSLSE